MPTRASISTGIDGMVDAGSPFELEDGLLVEGGSARCEEVTTTGPYGLADGAVWGPLSSPECDTISTWIRGGEPLAILKFVLTDGE